MLVYNSWDKNYKQPFGAVKQESPICFAVRPDKNLSVNKAKLRITPDGQPEIYYEMKKLSITEEYDNFTCEICIDRPGLYWYDFELETPEGLKYITLLDGGHGTVSNQSEVKWQLTVYEADFKTPGWLKGGIMYQIFPDRFAKIGDLPEDIPHDRYLREDWGGVPEYRGDEDGKYMNNTYFGGNLKGIISKLLYLKSLGVNAIYLNPVFEAHSNHRYNTADYMRIDPMLGNEDDFIKLCKEAESLSIKIILDGVFSHTGDDSRYFNRLGRYKDETGAYQSKDSYYFKWYDFKKWPDDYRCWWGFRTLPEVNEIDESFLSFITVSKGVLEHWQKNGVGGWRLDVADELPDEFLMRFRKSVKSSDENSVIYGEVWEDASKKVSYGKRRAYLTGSELDSTMNYPFREAIIAYLKGSGAQAFGNSVMTILENYPKPSIDILMNLLGTHDTARILTELAGHSSSGRDREWKANQRLNAEQRVKGLKLVKIAAVLQFLLPGVPCIYYGDEAGFEGYEDPFNRQCYRWGEENDTLIRFYVHLGALRRACPALGTGEFKIIQANGDFILFERIENKNSLICAINVGSDEESFVITEEYSMILQGELRQKDNLVLLAPESFAVLGKGSWVDDMMHLFTKSS